jgi:hypothetical protein
MSSLIPKRMFRAHDADKTVGVLFVLAHKHGSEGKVVWRPDSEALPPGEEYVEDFDKWESAALARAITRISEIPISEGTERVSVTQVSMVAAPFLKPGAPS